MKKLLFRVCTGISAVLFFYAASAQTRTNTAFLRQAGIERAAKEKSDYQKLIVLAREKGWPTVIKKKGGGITALVGVDALGTPLYISTDNATAAATIGTNKLWSTGTSGLNLDGGSAAVKGKLAIWDGGNLRASHVEFSNRINQKDNAPLSDHATHVAGTMIAAGINPSAKGMSNKQQQLIAYSYLQNSDLSEMLTEAPNLLVSNHSYGFNAGWQFQNNRWEWLGPVGATEDYKFGYYSSVAQSWDELAFNAPNYLIVKSSGNSRDENGPAVGEQYYRVNGSGEMTATTRNANMSSNDGYDILSTTSNAKNILLVGAINPITSGYHGPNDVVMSSFSAWGPTDDGRIKPDVVADGVGLFSPIDESDNTYAVFSGTSMATPTVSGSVLLLQEYYERLHPGTFMRSATLRGLVIHTTNEAGPSPGPDYQHGWGVVDMAKAASVIGGANGSGTHIIQQNVLTNGNTFTQNVIASGNGTLVATICWTDPKGNVEAEGTLNSTQRKLVNDLDIVIKKGATVYRPWILDPTNRDAAATTGDNIRDNVEKIELPDVLPGQTYTIEITHKGTLQGASQAYSLIVSGVTSTGYCISTPTSNAGARIDSVSVGSIRRKNAAGCTTYSDFTAAIGTVEPGQAIPFFARLNSCDASTADKIVKVFIDANNDGDFTDAGELLATSNTINGNGDFNTNINLPASLTPGKTTILRIVMQETNDANAVTSCGNYTRGETQDYRIRINTPATDVGITELISPSTGECSSNVRFATVRIRNFGSVDKDHIPVSVVVKQGAATVITINDIFPGIVKAGSDVIYTLQTSFVTAGNTTYTITSNTSLAGDQGTDNNENVTTITTSAASPDPAATALTCTTQTSLAVTSGQDEAYTWYNAAAATTPIATGATATVNSVLPTYYVGRNESNLKVSPANKAAFASGSYNTFNGNFMTFNNSVPVLIETARLYIGNANTSRKLRIIVGRDLEVADPSTGSFRYIPEATVNLDIFATDPTPQAPGVDGSGASIPVPDDPADQGAVFYLNLPIVETGEHIMMVTYDDDNDEASIFRNNAITTSPYPTGFPGIFQFTGNSVSISPSGDDFRKFYYFFYDMKISYGGCPAPARKAITSSPAPPPTIVLANNIFTSSAALGNQWLRNGVPVPGEVGSTFAPTVSGKYSVQVNNNGCILTSNEIDFTATSIPNVDPSRIGLVVSPVPARGSFNMQFEVRTKADLDIALISMNGQTVYHSSIPDFIGRYSQSIQPGKIASGVYYLQVIHDRKRYVRKVIIVD